MKTRKRRQPEDKASAAKSPAAKRKAPAKRGSPDPPPAAKTTKAKAGKSGKKQKAKTSPSKETVSSRKSIVLVPTPTAPRRKKSHKEKRSKKARGTKKSVPRDTQQEEDYETGPSKSSTPSRGDAAARGSAPDPLPLDTAAQGSRAATAASLEPAEGISAQEAVSNRRVLPEPTAAGPNPDPDEGSDQEKEHGAMESLTEWEEDHRYSKDPKDELMKLNLPIYACSMCKRYTFDPQQAALHSRIDHNAKVGIIFMLPLEGIKVPEKSMLKAATKPTGLPPGIVCTPAKSQVAPQTDSQPTPSGQQPLKLNKLATVELRERTEKTMFECSNCKRQFDRVRQMKMHKCIEVGSRRQSPRKGDESGKTLPIMAASPVKLAEDREKGTDHVAKTGHQENPSTPVKDQQDSENNKDALKGTEECAKKTAEQHDVWEELNEKKAKELKSGGKESTRWKVQKMLEDFQKAKEASIKRSAVKTPNEGGTVAVAGEGDDDDDIDDDDDDNEILGIDEEEDDSSEMNDMLNDIEVEISAADDQNGSSSEGKKNSTLYGADDVMVKQWENREPPTRAELNKFIKTVQGGLQSGKGQPIEFFMCTMCRRVFKTRNVLKPHLYSHLGYSPHACETCGYTATHSHGLDLHEKRHFGNGFKCLHNPCKFVGKGKEDLVKHRKTHFKSLECELCGDQLLSQSTLLGHLCISHADEIKEGKEKKYYSRMLMTGRKTSSLVLFECDICGLKTKTKRAYYNHIRIHSAIKLPPTTAGTTPASANTSSTEEKSSRRAKRDARRSVAGPGPFKCPMCEFHTHTEDSLQRHMSSHPFVYRCCACEEKFLTYGSLNEHVGSHQNDQPDFNPQEKINESLRKSMYLAGQMDKALEADKIQWAQRRTGALAPQSAITGSAFDELMSKISIPSEDVSKEELEELGKPFAVMIYKRLTPSILRYIHMRFGNVECGVCGKLFPKVGLCKDHTKKHTQVKNFLCTKCPVQLGSKFALSKHMAKLHGDGEKFLCDICKAVILGKEVYDSHMKKHSSENEGPFTCTWCNTVEDKSEDMKNHVMNTHPMMPLAESSKILGVGVVIHREKSAPFLVCDVCNETFRRICDLRRHMWKHSTVKRFTCDLCDYGSDKRGNIISHMRKHSDDRSYICEVCSKAYKTEQSLKLHVRTAHLKLKPFKCDLCDYAASQPVHLRRHRVLHHEDGERRRFRCALCPEYRAADLQIVKRHYYKKHPTEKVNMSKCCPPGWKSASASRKDKHQVIQVVPSAPAVLEAAPNTEPAEEIVQEESEEAKRSSPAMDPPVVTDEQQSQDITNGMTVEVVLPEDHAQLIDINSALPDVINALAALQDFNNH